MIKTKIQDRNCILKDTVPANTLRLAAVECTGGYFFTYTNGQKLKGKTAEFNGVIYGLAPSGRFSLGEVEEILNNA